VLITVEGLRPDFLSCYGKGSGGKTPNIDKLAAEGSLFEQVVTPSASTLPSIATLLTGRTPFQHGVWDDTYRNVLPDSETSLAETLQEKGYRTAAFLGTSRMAVGRGFDQGFDIFKDGYTPAPSGAWKLVLSRSQTVVGQASTWLVGIQDRAFFLWIHLTEPVLPGKGPITQPKADLRTEYQGRVSTLDGDLGKLLDQLRSRADYSNLIIVLAADHGMGLDEHGERRSGSFLYEPILRVPLIVRAPGAKAGKRVGELAGLVDVFPSLAGALKLPLPAGLKGRDLFTARGPAAPAYHATALAGREQFGWAAKEAIAQGSWRLILSPRPELYDIGTDPLQAHDQASSHPEEVSRLKGLRDSLAGGAAIPPAHYLVGSVPDPGLGQKLKEKGFAPATKEAALRRSPPDPRKFGDSLLLLEQMQFFTEALGNQAMRSFAQDLLKIDPESLFTLMGLASLDVESKNEEARKKASDMLMTAQELYPLEAEVYHQLAHSALGQKRFADAQWLLKVSLALNPRHPAEIRYDLACARALGGDKIGALSDLKESVKEGFRDVEHIKNDPDLEAIRTDAAFVRFLKDEFPSAGTL
jgi:arylsulfatase A-like enzyme